MSNATSDKNSKMLSESLPEELQQDLRLLAEQVQDKDLQLAMAALFAHPLCMNEFKKELKAVLQTGVTDEH